MIHYELKPFVCRICGKAFRQKSHHKYHVEHIHKSKDKINQIKTFKMFDQENDLSELPAGDI